MWLACGGALAEHDELRIYSRPPYDYTILKSLCLHLLINNSLIFVPMLASNPLYKPMLVLNRANVDCHVGLQSSRTIYILFCRLTGIRVSDAEYVLIFI
jgi:hypothetical protein